MITNDHKVNEDKMSSNPCPLNEAEYSESEAMNESDGRSNRVYPLETGDHRNNSNDVGHLISSSTNSASDSNTCILVSRNGLVSGVLEEVTSQILQEENLIPFNECHDIALVPPDVTNVPSEAAILDSDSHPGIREGTTCRQSTGTKSRFRASRSAVPGAIASYPSNSFSVRSHTSFDNISQEEFVSTATAIQRSDIESVENSDAASPAVPHIVTAEVVENGTLLDQSERRRIVEETIQNISNQAATAEVVHTYKSGRKYWAVLFVFMVVGLAFAAVAVIVLKTRSSESDAAPATSPTPFVYDSVFRTTEELYQAVDGYIMSTSSKGSNVSSVQSSDVAIRYGYPISSWNVSLLTNFSYVFDPTRVNVDNTWEFNEDLADWDVSNAKTMAGMFKGAYAFQGIGLENWNVGKVKDFSFMFYSSGFNGTISGWDTSNAESMASMFHFTDYFNGDLSMWNVSQVLSMNSMFAAASVFEGFGLEYWDVHNVQDFSYMFLSTPVFNGTISGWDTSNAVTLEGMFRLSSIFNDNLSLWDVSKVTSLDYTFSSAFAYTGDGIASWNVSKVTTMTSLFSDAYAFNGDVSQWDVRRVSSLYQMVRTFGIVF